MEKLLKIALQFGEFKLPADDDAVDRLNREHTPALLVMFAVLVSLKQYVGEPISCWCPAQFTSSHISYANTVCWVSNTYYVPFHKRQPLLTEPRHVVAYYQWVPVVLLSQALVFFLPCLLWRLLHRRVGLNVAAIIEAATSCQRAGNGETREKAIRYMVAHLDSYLHRHHNAKRGCFGRAKLTLAKHCCLVYGRMYGNYLTCSYLLCKTIYLCATVAQLFVLDEFLGFDGFHAYGLRVMGRMLSGRDWWASERFPRVTLCDFRIRQQANVHRYTVQCSLPINLFNEKIFLFVWFWLLIVALATFASLCHWCAKLLILQIQLPYIKRQLRSVELHRRETRVARRFTEHYLRRDGLLIVRLVSKNAGDLIAAELLHGLWTNYGPERRANSEHAASGTPAPQELV